VGGSLFIGVLYLPKMPKFIIINTDCILEDKSGKGEL